MIYLDVGYDDKDDAKTFGAKWDSKARKWYFPGGDLPQELEKYAPEGFRAEDDYQNEITNAMQALFDSIPETVELVLSEVKKTVSNIDSKKVLFGGLTNDETLDCYHDTIASSENIETIGLTCRESIARKLWSDSEALNKFLQGDHAPGNVVRALMTTFNGARTETNQDKLDTVNKINIKDVVARSFQSVLNDKCTAMWDEKKAEEKAKYNGLSDIDTDVIDYRNLPSEMVINGYTLIFYSDCLKCVNGNDRIERNGRFVGWISQLDSYKILSSEISKRIKAREEAKVHSVKLSNQHDVIFSGNDWSTQSSDGRKISGFAADGEWYLQKVHTHDVDANIPGAVAIAEQVKEKYHSQVK